jgi:hypothetical protein
MKVAAIEIPGHFQRPGNVCLLDVTNVIERPFYCVSGPALPRAMLASRGCWLLQIHDNDSLRCVWIIKANGSDRPPVLGSSMAPLKGTTVTRAVLLARRRSSTRDLHHLELSTGAAIIEKCGPFQFHERAAVRAKKFACAGREYRGPGHEQDWCYLFAAC